MAAAGPLVPQVPSRPKTVLSAETLPPTFSSHSSVVHSTTGALPSVFFGAALMSLDGGGGMRAAEKLGRWLGGLRNLGPQTPRPRIVIPPPLPKIGLALGGGFARGIAHAGILQAFERHQIPIHCITGVSAGSIAAAAYASGASPEEIARAGCAMRFGDVARWSLGRMGFVVSERMKRFLERLLKHYQFEEMPRPLGVIATDLATGEPVRF